MKRFPCRCLNPRQRATTPLYGLPCDVERSMLTERGRVVSVPKAVDAPLDLLIVVVPGLDLHHSGEDGDGDVQKPS